MFKGVLEVDLEGEIEGESKVDFKQDLEGDLLSSSCQVQVRSSLVKVWFSLQFKSNFLELDSEVE